MAIGLIIIGDEILSGKRVDQHFSKVVELLLARGMQLAWCEIIGDDPARITATLERTLATADIVFSCGGIGATPDDHTRQCAAAALGVPLLLHPEAKLQIQQRITESAAEIGAAVDLNSAENLQRLKMGEFPRDATLIPNSYNRIPGFSIKGSGGGAHHFVPGFPVMAWPMIESVLDTHYAHLFHQGELVERSTLVFDAAESTLTPLMEAIEQQFAGIRIFSLPNVGDAHIRRHIELGVKGPAALVDAAFVHLLMELQRLKVEFSNGG